MKPYYDGVCLWAGTAYRDWHIQFNDDGSYTVYDPKLQIASNSKEYDICKTIAECKAIIDQKLG